MVFPELASQEWTGKEFHDEFFIAVPDAKRVAKYLFKLRNDEPPNWAKAMWHVPGNADVYRLDDLGDDDPKDPTSRHWFGKRTVKTNGFALVHVDPSAPPAPAVTVEPKSLPPPWETPHLEKPACTPR